MANLLSRVPKRSQLGVAAMVGVIRQKLWSNNPLERLNKEIRRLTDVVGT